MKKILLIDDSDTYTWCLQKYLQHRGYPVKTACTLKEARAAIQEEMPLVVCCDLDLPDGSGMDFLDEVRAADKELPFILASCHDKDDYEQEAMRRGATLCMDKMKSSGDAAYSFSIFCKRKSYSLESSTMAVIA